MTYFSMDDQLNANNALHPILSVLTAIRQMKLLAISQSLLTLEIGKINLITEPGTSKHIQAVRFATTHKPGIKRKRFFSKASAIFIKCLIRLLSWNH